MKQLPAWKKTPSSKSEQLPATTTKHLPAAHKGINLKHTASMSSYSIKKQHSSSYARVLQMYLNYTQYYQEELQNQESQYYTHEVEQILDVQGSQSQMDVHRFWRHREGHRRRAGCREDHHLGGHREGRRPGPREGRRLEGGHKEERRPGHRAGCRDSHREGRCSRRREGHQREGRHMHGVA
jgi:hypothetical protein